MKPILYVLCVLFSALSLNVVQPAWAIGDGSKLHIVQLQYAGNWNTRGTAASVLAQELRFRTSIDVHLKSISVSSTDKRLFELPFAMLSGSGRFRLSSREQKELRKWVQGGGFLLIDNTGRTDPSPSFDQSVRALIQSLFPNQVLQRIPPQHVVYRTFYVLDFPSGRVIRRPFLEGLFIDGRIAILYSQNDLTGALERDRLGDWLFDVEPGGEAQREKAKRLAINIVQYAMCLNYKDDQVHLDHLLHDRKWRAPSPSPIQQ